MDLVGTTLGQYHIVEAIGHGGMAVVYKAQQPVLDRLVAIKVLLPHQADTPEFRARFTREAKAVAQLNHPNILPIIDYGQSADLNYIVMKYVASGTLADRLKHPIDLTTTARLITQIAAALDHAHQRGILHRDVKPSNVLLDEGEWVQLADFGLAKMLISEQDLTTSGLSMGTPAYLSPEQGQGLPCDHHSDIYSLGVIAYEMITGRLPFTAETPMGVIIKHIYDQPPSPRGLNPQLSETIEAVLVKGLAKPIEQRYHSAGELATALQLAIAASPTMALSPVVGLDSNATPQIVAPTAPRTVPRLTPSTPIAVSNKILFEETVPTTPHFIGREAELAAYQAQLERDRFLIITGLAGMGKTTLGAKLARAVSATPDDVFWFTFDPIEKSTTDALYWALAAFLDNRGEPSLAKYLRGEIGAQKPLERMAKLNLLSAALATGNYVLCFDDVQIAQDVPDLAYFFKLIRQRFVELKQPLPATFILMGRSVPPDLEVLVAQSLRGLTEDATGQFLAERDVVLPRELTQQLWQHTEGNPKLLELSASNLAGLSVEAAATFITTLVRRGDIRDYLMRNIYSTLTPDEQLVMGALAVFPGPIARDGVEELLAEEQLGRVAQHLDALVNKHVLTLDPDDQIDCHDLVREYCYHILTRRDRDRFHQRAALYFEQEQNWLAAAHHHYERREAARSLDLLITHADAIINAGGVAALTQQLGLFNAATLTPEQRVLLHKTQGHAFSLQGHYQSAIAAYAAAQEEATQDQIRAETLWLIARTYLKLGDYEQTREYCTRSLQLSENGLADPIGIARAHHDLGWAHYRLGHFPPAAQHFLIAEQLAQNGHDILLAAQASLALGVVAWRENRLEEARDRFEASRRVFRELGDRTGEANAIGNLGIVFKALRRTDEELACHLQATAIYEQIGDIHGLLYAANNAGYLFLTKGNWREATRHYTRLESLAQESGQKPMLSLAWCGLADVHLAQGDVRRALDYASQARQLAEELGMGLELGVAGRVLGDIWLALDDAPQAQRYFEESLPILEQYQDVEDLTKAQVGYQTALSRLGLNPIQ
jgi:serine/threonine protein kinase/tetratricopeptide (TPR) repeat protein